MTKLKKFENTKSEFGKNFKSIKSDAESKLALENFVTNVTRGPRPLHCKFCDSDGHSSYYCSQYKTREQRVERCKALKLCFRCTSNKHITTGCPGKNGGLDNHCRVSCCGSSGHVSSMCHKDSSTGGTSDKSPPDKVVKGITDVCFSTGVEESLQLFLS